MGGRLIGAVLHSENEPMNYCNSTINSVIIIVTVTYSQKENEMRKLTTGDKSDVN